MVSGVPASGARLGDARTTRGDLRLAWRASRSADHPIAGTKRLAIDKMRITQIDAYRVELPLHEGSYKWSGGNAVAVFDSTVVAVSTDEGITGYGEVCPLGSAYLAAYANGARTGIAELAPSLIGLDPTELGVLNTHMDRAMRGHPYVKSPIDVACWDILGKSCGKPVATLLGGRFGADFPLYRAISQDTPEAMAERVAQYRSEGYTKFQLKVGSDV